MRLTLNDTHQLLACGGDNLQGNNIKRNTEILLYGSKKVGLDMSTESTQHT
jgi:hypothetical protein